MFCVLWLGFLFVPAIKAQINDTGRKTDENHGILPERKVLGTLALEMLPIDDATYNTLKCVRFFGIELWQAKMKGSIVKTYRKTGDPDTDPICIILIPFSGVQPISAIRTAVPAYALPQACTKYDDFYIQYAKVPINKTYGFLGNEINSRKTYESGSGAVVHDGALYCCKTDECNGQPLSPYQKIRQDVQYDADRNWIKSLPLVVVITITAIAFWPYISHVQDENGKTAREKIELAEMLTEQRFQTNNESEATKTPPIQESRLNDVVLSTLATGLFTQLPKLNFVLRHLGDAVHMNTLLSANFKKELRAAFQIMDFDKWRFEHQAKVMCCDANKTCKVSRRTASKYVDLVDKMIEFGPYEMEFTVEELCDLFNDVATVMESEPNVVHLPGGLIVVGNLNGSYMDLWRFLQWHGFPPKTKYLFLGGLTDHSEQYSLETLALVLALKKAQPDAVHVLRGASECRELKLNHRFPERIARCLGTIIQNICSKMPLAAIVGGRIFCVHGGVSPHITDIDSINAVKRDVAEVPEDGIVGDLIFSILDGHTTKIPGGRGYRFSPDVAEKFLKKTNLSGMIRTRSPVNNGVMILGSSIVNVWSAPGKRFCEYGSVLRISSEGVTTAYKLTRRSQREFPVLLNEPIKDNWGEENREKVERIRKRIAKRGEAKDKEKKEEEGEKKEKEKEKEKEKDNKKEKKE